MGPRYNSKDKHLELLKGFSYMVVKVLYSLGKLYIRISWTEA